MKYLITGWIILFSIFYFSNTGYSQQTQPKSVLSSGASHVNNGTYTGFSIVGQTATSAKTIQLTGYTNISGFLNVMILNQAPVADAGSDDIVLENTSYTLDGSASTDADNDPLIYSWQSLDGISISNTSSVQPTINTPAELAQRKYRFVLTVDDGTVISDPDTVTITVRDVNWMPVVYTNSTVTYGLVTLDNIVADAGDVVGAFINGECRAVSEVIPYGGQAYVTFNIQGTTTETVNFEVYDLDAHQVCLVPVTYSTNPAGNLGSGAVPIPIDANCNIQNMLQVSTNTINVSDVSGSTSINVTSNVNWTATTNSNWFTITPLSSSNNGIITVTYTANVTNVNRLDSIVVSGGGISETIIITQSGNINGVNTPNYTFTTSTPESGVFLGQAQIGGVPADSFDWIAALDSTGQCIGANQIVFNNNIAYINLVIYGDDPTTANIDEGVSPGEYFTLQLFDASENKYMNYPTDANEFHFTQWSNANGAPMSAYSDFTEVYNFLTEVNDTIILDAGWNLVSTDVIALDTSISGFFSDLGNNLVYVTGFDNGSMFYNADPTFPPFLNTLSVVERGYGYWVRVNTNDTLIIQGEPLSSTFRRGLDANWNLMGFVPQGTATPANYLSDIISTGNLIYVTGFSTSGSSFYNPDPGFPSFLNTLSILENSKGYWVKVNNPVSGIENTQSDWLTTNVFDFVYGTSNLYNFIGDTVYVKTLDGKLRGKMEILPNGYLMTTPLYGDDPHSNIVDGILLGDTLAFEFKGETIVSDVTFMGNQSLFQVNLNYNTTNTIDFSRLNNIKCYPNPFTSTVYIDYNLSQYSDISIMVYNDLGQEVENLIHTQQQAGEHQLIWNSTNLSDGIYTIVFKINNQIITTYNIINQ